MPPLNRHVVDARMVLASAIPLPEHWTTSFKRFVQEHLSAVTIVAVLGLENELLVKYGSTDLQFVETRILQYVEQSLKADTTIAFSKDEIDKPYRRVDRELNGINMPVYMAASPIDLSIFQLDAAANAYPVFPEYWSLPFCQYSVERLSPDQTLELIRISDEYMAVNGLENTSRSIYPAIGQALDWLLKQYHVAQFPGKFYVPIEPEERLRKSETDQNIQRPEAPTMSQNNDQVLPAHWMPPFQQAVLEYLNPDQIRLLIRSEQKLLANNPYMGRHAIGRTLRAEFIERILENRLLTNSDKNSLPWSIINTDPDVPFDLSIDISEPDTSDTSGQQPGDEAVIAAVNSMELVVDEPDASNAATRDHVDALVIRSQEIAEEERLKHESSNGQDDNQATASQDVTAAIALHDQSVDQLIQTSQAVEKAAVFLITDIDFDTATLDSLSSVWSPAFVLSVKTRFDEKQLPAIKAAFKTHLFEGRQQFPDDMASAVSYAEINALRTVEMEHQIAMRASPDVNLNVKVGGLDELADAPVADESMGIERSTRASIAMDDYHPEIEEGMLPEKNGTFPLRFNYQSFPGARTYSMVLLYETEQACQVAWNAIRESREREATTLFNGESLKDVPRSHVQYDPTKGGQLGPGKGNMPTHPDVAIRQHAAAHPTAPEVSETDRENLAPQMTPKTTLESLEERVARLETWVLGPGILKGDNWSYATVAHSSAKRPQANRYRFHERSKVPYLPIQSYGANCEPNEEEIQFLAALAAIEQDIALVEAVVLDEYLPANGVSRSQFGAMVRDRAFSYMQPHHDGFNLLSCRDVPPSFNRRLDQAFSRLLALASQLSNK